MTGVGLGLTVIVFVCLHPLLSVYVIVAVPAATPVTRPVADTVAIELFDDVQEDAVPLPANCVVKP